MCDAGVWEAQRDPSRGHRAARHRADSGALGNGRAHHGDARARSHSSASGDPFDGGARRRGSGDPRRQSGDGHPGPPPRAETRGRSGRAGRRSLAPESQAKSRTGARRHRPLPVQRDRSDCSSQRYRAAHLHFGWRAWNTDALHPGPVSSAIWRIGSSPAPRVSAGRGRSPAGPTGPPLGRRAAREPRSPR